MAMVEIKKSDAERLMDKCDGPREALVEIANAIYDTGDTEIAKGLKKIIKSLEKFQYSVSVDSALKF